MAFTLFTTTIALVFAVIASCHGSEDTRPGYHYTRPSGWMNDPISLYDSSTSLYHLFPLCNPNSNIAPWAPGGVQGYCHATSTDLVHWQTQPLALNNSGGTGTVMKIDPAKDVTALPQGTRAVLLMGGGGMALSQDVNMTTW